MTGYENGAFEALNWAWRMLRDKEIQEGRDEIHAVLMRLGKSEKIDFNECARAARMMELNPKGHY